jgi:hypothetical protein
MFLVCVGGGARRAEQRSLLMIKTVCLSVCLPTYLTYLYGYRLSLFYHSSKQASPLLLPFVVAPNEGEGGREEEKKKKTEQPSLQPGRSSSI